MAQSREPDRGWYFVAAALALAGLSAGIALFWTAYASLAAPIEFVVPGTFAFEISKPGRYALWHDHATRFQGEVFSVDPRLPSGVRIRILGPQGPVELRRPHGTTTTRDGQTKRVLIDGFDATVAGRHEISVEGSFPRRVLSVGPDNILYAIACVIGGVGAVLLGFAGGAVLAAWNYFRREAALRRNQPERNTMTSETPAGNSETEHSLKQLTQLVYALQAASFLVGFSAIAAVIVNYVKREDVAGTLFESHFRWQIRTFWWSLLWGVIGALLFVVVIGIAILAADAIWFLYRIIKGWLRLSEGKPMYPEENAGPQT